MSSDCVIGIDQGTSGTKALLLDRDGTLVAEAERPIAISHPQAGWVEQDPEAMVANVVACARELLEPAQVSAERIAGLGLDNHTETLVLWDPETGRPVHPAIVWQCRRSTPQSEAIDSAETRWLIRARTGLDLDPTFTATKLSWIFENRPDLAEGLAAGRLLWGTVDCWLIWKLTGGDCYTTESSNASRTMLFSIADLTWDEDLAALFGLTLGRWPELRLSTGPFGSCQADLLGSKIPITGALGDQQTSLFGHGCLRQGAFKCTYGTGAFVWMNGGHSYRPQKDTGYLQTVAGQLDRPTYALEGFVMSAGAVLDWLAGNLGLGRDAAEIARKAERASASGGTILVPALNGLASPWWEPNARAALMGMDSSTEDAQVCHAALEAVCFQVRRVLEDMRSADLQPSGSVRVDGGLTRSPYLLQMQADILGLPVRRSEIEHLTPYGVALLAGLGAGLWSDPSALKSVTDGGASFTPEPETRTGWETAYGRSCKAVEAALDLAS